MLDFFLLMAPPQYLKTNFLYTQLWFYYQGFAKCVLEGGRYLTTFIDSSSLYMNLYFQTFVGTKNSILELLEVLSLCFICWIMYRVICDIKTDSFLTSTKWCGSIRLRTVAGSRRQLTSPRNFMATGNGADCDFRVIKLRANGTLLCIAF